MLLVVVYGDNDHCCVSSKRTEEAEMACAGKSTHVIVSHKISGAKQVLYHKFRRCLQFWRVSLGRNEKRVEE